MSIGHRTVAGLAIAFLVAAATGGALGQAKPPTYAQLVKEGTVLAERLCSTCHVMEGVSSGAASAGVPSMRGLANLAGQTAQRIRNVLINPHPPMPDVRLSNPEIDRLLAYIDSLRAESSGPALVPRGEVGAKPTYPDPT
jgi:mono/diheme cytochrome c family protein